MREVKMKRPILFAFLLLSLTQAAQADPTLFGHEEDRFGPKPGAFTVTMGSGIYVRGRAQVLPVGSDKFSKIWHYGLRVGYAFSRYVELESHLGFTPTTTNFNALNVWEYGVNGVGQLPVTDRFVPYLTLGAGAATFDEEYGLRLTRFAVNYGAGVKFFVFKSLALRPEIRALTSFDSVHTAIIGTLNLTYYFGYATPTPVPTATPEPTAAPEPPPVATVLPVPTASPVPVETPPPPLTPREELMEFTGVVEGIAFDFNSAVIKKESYAKLDRAAAAFKKFPALQVGIAGHTDGIGSKAVNQRLSQRRAEAVKKYLVDHGLDENQITAEGFGASRPIATNKTPGGRAKNRRIEINLVNLGELQKK